jgi:hypothetical protein
MAGSPWVHGPHWPADWSGSQRPGVFRGPIGGQCLGGGAQVDFDAFCHPDRGGCHVNDDRFPAGDGPELNVNRRTVRGYQSEVAAIPDQLQGLTDRWIHRTRGKPGGSHGGGDGLQAER